MSDVFGNPSRPNLIHHRALNSWDKFDAAVAAVQKFPGLSHVFEGDVCWNFAGARRDIYFRHPSLVFDSLSTAQIVRQIQERTLVTLDEALSRLPLNCRMVIEIKVGNGDWRVFLDALVQALNQGAEGRYWIDGFSLSKLRHLKRQHPGIPVSLHTEMVIGTRAFVGAPEWPPFDLVRLDALPEIDAIAIRWRGSQSHMERASGRVKAAGKHLIISRIFDLPRFKKARSFGASACYIHGDFELYAQAEIASGTRPV